ncbi:MAG: ABC transporter ATP-binding protein [Gammaproteobacteria bacterium]|jgi:putative ABC transport system ATP-binding protein
MPAPVLKARGITKAYPGPHGSVQVLEGLEMTIDAGQHVALLGRSGSGKSTLLNLLGGIDRPDAGEIEIGGVSIGRLSEHDRTLVRRRRVGYIYQAFNLIPTLTAVENTALPLELNGVAADAAARDAAALLGRVGLGERLDAFPDQLSGGEQQRVAIARAVVHQPELILADEPTGNLDARTGNDVLDLLYGLSAERRQAMLIVTHSRAVADRASRIVTLHEGRLQDVGEALAW